MKIVDSIIRLYYITINPHSSWKDELKIKEEWGAILRYFLTPIIIISAFITFSGIFIQAQGKQWLAFRHFVAIIVTGNVGVFLIAYSISKLAPSFGGVSDFNKSFKLLVFSSFIYFISISLSKILPSIDYLFYAVSLYGLYIFFEGSEIMLNIKQDRKVGYSLVCLMIFILIFFLLDIFAGILFVLKI